MFACFACFIMVVQDGDQFQVLWDETLLQPRNSAPSDYNTIQPVRVRSSRLCVSHMYSVL